MFAELKILLSKTQKSNVKYGIYTNKCPGEYIGQTKRQLGIRINEHKKQLKN